MARSRRRLLAGRSSWERAFGASLRAIPSWASFERLEQRQVLATDVNVSVGLGLTQIDSSVHGSDERIVKQGDGTLVLSAANTHSGGVVVASGTLVVRNVAALGIGPVEVQAGAKLVLDDGSGTVEATSLVLQEGGLIDVGSSKLSIQTGFTQAMLISAIQSAKGDGSWNGESGIGSSVVRSLLEDGTPRTLGWLTWVANADSSYTVGFAAAGDTNLDGSVDIVDLSNIFNAAYVDPGLTATWEAGDFNHDGIVDTLDLSELIAANLFDVGNYLPPQPPSVPTDLVATGTSSTTATLTWTNEDTPAGFEIEQSSNGVSGWQAVTLVSLTDAGNGNKVAIVGGLVPGAETHFRVRSYNDSPSWWWDDRYRSADTATMIPASPENVSARGVTPTQVVVTWTPGPGGRTGYVVERQAAGQSTWTTLGQVSGTARHYVDGTVAVGESYEYRVAAKYGTNASDAALPVAGAVSPPVSPPATTTDFDADGLPDLMELNIGTNPDAQETNGDGLSDGYADADADGVPNLVELGLQTNAGLADTDGDGVGDFDEIQQGSDPNDESDDGVAPPTPDASATWSYRVEFTTHNGGGNLRRFAEELKESRVVTIPSGVPLPALLTVEWSVDDEVKLNGTQLGGSLANSGATTMLVSTRWLSVDLFDTVGVNWGGYVEFVKTPVDQGKDGVPCEPCRSTAPNLGTGALNFTDGAAASGGGDGLSGPVALRWDQANPSEAGPSAQSSAFGNEWSSNASPRLTASGSNTSDPKFVSLVFSGDDTRVFTRASGASEPSVYSRANGQGSSDTLSYVNGQYIFSTASGDVLTFNGFGEGVSAAERGQIVSREDAYGNRIDYSYNGDGTTSEIASFRNGEATAAEVQEYGYVAAGNPNAGKVSRIDIRRGDDTLVRTVALSYYDGSLSVGSTGDLAAITVHDSAGNLLDTKQYRYTTAANGSSLIQYTFDTDAVRRAAAAGVNLLTASAAAVKPFATNYYEYDSHNRVSRHDVQGAGCTSCSGGIGAYSYTYATNPSQMLAGTAATAGWATKTTETRPDGSQRIVYSNARTQPMLEVIRTTQGGVTTQTGTYTRYDFRGLPIWKVSPSAVSLPVDLAVIEQYPDLLHEVDGNFQYISDSSGLIEVTNYFTGTWASASFGGAVDRLVSSTGVMRGDTSPLITQESFTYFLQTGADGSRVSPLATRTTYTGDYSTGVQTTSYAYTFASGTTQILAQEATLPGVNTSQNGPEVADIVTQIFDASGRVIWSKDGDGFLTYTAYDAGTGAVVKSITDVDTFRTSEFPGLPAGWGTPAGGGLHLVTAYEVDRLGRTTKTTDPQGNITYTVYNDVNHEARTYVGWNATTHTTTGPIQVSRRDLSGTYTESLTFASTPAVNSAGLPTGTETITNVQSLTRSIVNAAGQVIAVDRYMNLAGLTYSTAQTLGSEGTNYLRTRYAYDNHAKVDRVQSPAGTIKHSVYDAFSRLVATWIGTDDSTTNGYKWTPTTGSASSNMTLIETRAYDVNSNVVEVARLPGGGTSPRTTHVFYDWRNRAVATKVGASATPAAEEASLNRPLTYTEYDNLSRVVGESVFDGDGVALVDADTDGVPDKPSADLLRSSRLSFYDSRNRIYRSQDLCVNQATGEVGAAALTTDLFYDHRGNVVMTIAPNAPVVQSRFDGAGRLAATYTLGNLPGQTWANATSLDDSLVLEQTEYGFDAVGNVILTTARQRFDDASTTAYGDLGTPTSGIPARVSYTAGYFDAANRLTASANVGTNGGAAYTRSATIPTRSDTVLVTTYSHDAAGRVEDVTDPNGVISHTHYDALGRTTITIMNYTGNAPDAQSDVTTVFTFDSSGRLASRTAVQPSGTPSQVTAYVYGVSAATGSSIASNDIMAETRYPDPTTGLASSTEHDVYTTNALGERISFTDRAGTTHTYSYDVVGRQRADAVTALGSGVNGAVRRIESAYDSLGRVTTVTSFNASSGGSVTNQVARAFNGFGQLTSEWQSHTRLVDTATTPRVQYVYSEGDGGNHSRLTQIVTPDGTVTGFTYTGIDDAASRVSAMTGPAADGSETSVSLEVFKYLGVRAVVERARPEIGIMLTMATTTEATGDAGDRYTGFDRFGRVVDQRWITGSGSTATDVDRYGYAYDRNGNRLARSNALASAFNETYSYDALNQLQDFARGSTSAPSTTQRWQFDALGNWTTVTTDGVDQSRTANAQNELTQAVSASLAYSNTGNLITDAQGRTLSYDAWNRLVSVSNASATQVAAYQYDGMNRRIVEQVAATGISSAPIRDVFYSQEWQVLEERLRTSGGDIPSTADTRYIWSPVYVDALLARDRNADANTSTGTGGLEERVYALQDANWNTTAIVAASGISGFSTGTVINRFVYTPYGESQALTASWGTPAAGSPSATPWQHFFQGLKFSDVTGLAYVRARDYSATLGRFIELDPIGFNAGDNNWHRFVANGPTGKTDPSGLYTIDETLRPRRPETPPVVLLDSLENLLVARVASEECKEEARRIARAIKNTWGRNSRWSLPSERAKGYWCYEWAHGFEDAFNLESSGRCFTADRHGASKPNGTTQPRVHAWIEITVIATKEVIYVDDGYGNGSQVNTTPPTPNGYSGPYSKNNNRREHCQQIPTAYRHDQPQPPSTGWLW